jgi:hypothetical protein
MKTRQPDRRVDIRSLACVLLTLVVVLSLAQPAHAALPPRPEPGAAPSPRGAIELRLQCMETESLGSIQTLVQWQDGLGGWHDVEDWRETLDELYTDGGRKRWYMSAEHFGTGPFRWVVYDETGMLGTSESFNMPAGSGQVVRTLLVL